MSRESVKTTSYNVPALEKGLDVLEALSAAQQPLSLAELSRQMDRSSSELFRMVDCLEKRGYIVKEEHSGSYILSLKLYELAHTHSPVERLLTAAAKPMRMLADEIRESCHISVIGQGKLIVLAQAENPDKVRLSIDIGAAFPLVHTVSGRLLLAHMPEDQLADALRHDEDYAEMSKEEKQQLAVKIEAIRSSGYSAAEDETHIGIKDLAVLVGNPHTGPTAALAIGYLTRRRNEKQKELLAALKTYAAQINELLGLKPIQYGGEPI